MKRSFRTLTLICAAMSILASCAKEESDPNSGKPAGPEPDQTYEYVFSLNEAALTRATLADDTILFEEGDKLGVVAVTPEKTTATKAEVFFAEERANIAFEITQKKGIEKNGLIYAFTPVEGGSERASTTSETQVLLSIPAEQTQNETTYDADAMPLVSIPFKAEATLPTGRKITAGGLTMTAVAAIAEFEIYSTFPGFTDQQILSVEWTAEGLAGNFTWDFASENPSLGTLTGNSAKTTVNTTESVAATKQDAAKIYMVVAPGQHAGAIKVKTTEAEYTLTLAEALTLEPGSVTPIEVNLENTTWNVAKTYRYRFAANAADNLFGTLSQPVGFFAGEENLEKTLAEGAFAYDREEALAAGAAVYAYYPYNAEATAANALALSIPATQTNTAEGGYDKSYIPVVAAPAAVSGTANTTEPNGTFEFHSLASVLKLNFFSANAAATEEKLESVTLAAEGAAGDFTWDLTAAKENWTFSGLDATSVTAAPAAPVAIGATAENAASVYLVLAPGTHNGVLTVETNHTSYELPLNAELTRATTQELNMELPTSSKGFGATLEEFEIVEFPTTFSDGATADLYGIDQQKTTITFSEGGFEAEDHVKGPYYAVYPEGAGTVNFNNGTFNGTVAAEQTLAEGKKSVDNAFAYFAKSNSPALVFKNATSLVKVTVMNENVSAITLTAKEGQSIAGDYTLTITEDNVSVAISEGKGASSITLKPAGATFAKGEYYVAVIPGATENLTVNFTIGEETATKTRTIETIARNTAADLGKFLGYDIANAQELLAWNNDAANWTKWDIVTLTDNIDCAGVITSENWTVRNFSGTLDGNNKTINNFVIEKAGKAALLATVSGNALVKDLTFDASCAISTSEAGEKISVAALATLVTGNASIENIVNHGSVTANGEAAGSVNGTDVGGLIGEFSSTGSVKSCKNYGAITFCASTKPSKWTDVGGIFGKVFKEKDVNAGTIVGCENYGEIKFDGVSNNGQSINLGGIVGGGSGATFTSCKNSGKVTCNTSEAGIGGTNIGGIIGLCNRDFCGLVKDCRNIGDLINTGTTSGEIRIGGCLAFGQDVAVAIEGFINEGKIANEFETSAANALGGIVGRIYGKGSEEKISGCQNSGVVYSHSMASDKSGGVAGILGYFEASAAEGIGQSTLFVDNCINTANITQYGLGTGNNHVGGVVGNVKGANAAGSILNCSNSGNVQNGTTADTYTGKWVYTGGIVGQFGIASGAIKGCTNSGDVINGVHSNQTSGNIRMGGIVGNADNTTFEDNTNSGTVKDVSLSYSIDFGGIIGRFNCNSTSTMKGCKNTGNIISENKYTGTANNAWIAMGGIIGRTTKTTLTLENCTNDCTLENKNTTLQNEIMGGILGYGASKAVIKSCSSKAIIINPNTAAIRSGVFGGTWVKDFIVTECSTGGKYGETVLDSSNYKTYAFGSGSTFKDTANITLAE